jgi:glycosyltransferase involved in cell wall biosynthesis
LLFDPLEPHNIADQLECFFRMSREQRIEMGRSARRRAEEKLSLKRYIDEWEATLATSRD